MNRLSIGLIGLAMFALPMSASASTSGDVDAKFRAMEARMTELEDKLESANDQLEVAADRLQNQQVVIDRVQTDVEASSGLASFLDTLEIGGWVSASYSYNLDDPDGRALGGANSGIGATTLGSNPLAPGTFVSIPVTGVAANPFKADSNSFAFDQLWFELERPVSEENRAGFRADIVFGKTAGLLSGLTGGDGRSGNDLEVYQAYVQYLAPIGENGVTFKAGKFATLIGAEVVQAPMNFNITRGQVYNLFQPITHSGILASTTLGPVDLAVGLVNGTRNFPASDIDVNKNKAVLWSIGASPTESLSISLAGTHGAAQEAGIGFVNQKSGDKESIYDLIINWAPSEKFEAYLNVDYIETEDQNFGDLSGYGAAVAGRYAISERTGISVRFEYIDLEREASGPINPALGLGFISPTVRDTPLEMITLTGTVDHKLANNLTVRGELRYDSIEDAGRSNSTDKLFLDSDGRAFGSPAVFGQSLVPGEDDQIVAGVEVIYTF